MKQLTILLFAAALCFGCKSDKKANVVDQLQIDTLQGTSFLSKPLIRRQIDIERDSLQLANYNAALKNYENDSLNVDYIVWLGRRIAYLGDYKKAIEIYTKGIEYYPENARFYRHRGHRYITLRQLDNAINDFKKAVQLIDGKEDMIEKDGIPNSQNIPLSTLHNNIWYHLGLAYYLKNDLPNALGAFQSCLKSSHNDDMQVATRHWLYMIFRRMNLPDEAAFVLEPVHKDMTIIENEAYFNLLLFYKGELTIEEVTGNNSTGSSEAAKYGIANWYYYNGEISEAKKQYQQLIDTGNWAGFGYIAAEADLSRME
ncbi:MAG: tetratricopeptide repeat protein [Flavobacteriaceae bacterium]